MRGNAYMHPNSLDARPEARHVESFRCPNGERKYPEDALKVGQKADDKRAPCFEMPPSLYNGQLFPFLKRGVAPLRANPKGVEGNPPAKDPDPGPND